MLMAYYIIHAGLGFWAGLGLGMLDCADMTLAASRTLGPLSIFFEVLFFFSEHFWQFSLYTDTGMGSKTQIH
jgi:hypothetical protein